MLGEHRELTNQARNLENSPWDVAYVYMIPHPYAPHISRLVIAGLVDPRGRTRRPDRLTLDWEATHESE